jgi:hypothetical protein
MLNSKDWNGLDVSKITKDEIEELLLCSGNEACKRTK